MKLSALKQQLLAKQHQLPEQDQRIITYPRPPFAAEAVQAPTEIAASVLASTYRQSADLTAMCQQPVLQNTAMLPLSKEEPTTSKIDRIKIIGITGSRGKTTTAVMVHEYLKAKGYQSILYSSAKIDSPLSYMDQHEACDSPLKNENMLLNILEEAEQYAADYLVMEISETAIAKGLTADIPFAVRALTTINPKHNEAQYSAEEYVRLKHAFFENIPAEEACTCVFGLTDTFTREAFNQLLRLNHHPKVTYGTKYICETRNADYTNLDCLLYDMHSSLKGLQMTIRVKDQSYRWQSDVIMAHNAMNVTCAVAIIEALGELDAAVFQQCIAHLQIPGREEVIAFQDRTIVIGLFLSPALENFQAFRAHASINQIKVVTGAVGSGYRGWDQSFASERYLSQRNAARQFAMQYVKDHADYVYLTSDDPGAEHPLTIAQELEGYLNAQIPSVIVVDRKEAIRRAILESRPGDIIYIAGRGNKKSFCDSETTVALFKDKEIVEAVLQQCSLM